jgi:hypothetical protein
MFPQPSRLRAAFSFGAPPMPEPWKLIEFVEHYPGGFQIGTQRGVPAEIADKLVKDGFAKIVGTIGETPAPAAAEPASTPKPPQHKRPHHGTR